MFAIIRASVGMPCKDEPFPQHQELSARYKSVSFGHNAGKITHTWPRPFRICILGAFLRIE